MVVSANSTYRIAWEFLFARRMCFWQPNNTRFCSNAQLGEPSCRDGSLRSFAMLCWLSESWQKWHQRKAPQWGRLVFQVLKHCSERHAFVRSKSWTLRPWASEVTSAMGSSPLRHVTSWLNRIKRVMFLLGALPWNMNNSTADIVSRYNGRL